MSRRDHFLSLRADAPAILPSFLMCDFGNLAREVELLHEADVKAFHLDVMDGNFVPNLSYGMPIVAGLRRLTDLPLDVHLMINHPEKYVGAFVEAGADAITFHIESTDNPVAILDEIRATDVAAGVALNPDTPFDAIVPCISKCDLVLTMSVNAGFGGQQFNPIALQKLSNAREQFGTEVLLEIDGGINVETIDRCATAGAQLFVVGSAIFKTPDYSKSVHELRSKATVS